MSEEMKKRIEEHRNKYGKECVKELESSNIGTVTPEQAVIILEPEHAPENFMCDGEISHDEAMRSWKHRLANVGLSLEQRTKAHVHIFG